MYIIHYAIRINNKMESKYHQLIDVNTNKSTMNTYREHITGNRKLAMKFEEREEAEKIAKIFETVHQTADIIRY